MAANDPHVTASKTLFVRNLPYTVTNDSLETIFSEFGPIKRAFVVKDKGNEKCRGFGYVTFSVVEDSVKAQSKLKKIEGRNVHILFAKKKLTVKSKRSQHKATTDDGDELDEGEDSDEKIEEKPSVQKHVSKHEQLKTVVVSWKPSKTDVLSFLKEPNVKNVAAVQQISKDDETQVAHVCFKSVRDAKRGCRKLSNKDVKGTIIETRLLAQVPRKEKRSWSEKTGATPKRELNKNPKQGRLIIRNLSFKCEQKDLEVAFEKFGAISEVSVPKKADGRPCGFGFVQFDDVAAADKAIKELNGKLLLGRPVAVDWSIQKKRYEAAKTDVDEQVVKCSIPKKKGENNKKNVDSSEEDMDTSDEDRRKNKSHSVLERGRVDSGNVSESEDDSDEDDFENCDKGSGNDDENNIAESSDADSRRKANIKDKKLGKRKSDVDQGRTLFIRNLPFTVLEEDLEEFLTEFGEISYCRLVMDPNTDHSKGSAFVQFKKKECADRCLEHASEGSIDDRNTGLSLGGRKLLINIAVSRQKLVELNDKEKKLKENKDKRNLFLAREGLIRSGTEEAKGLSKGDLDKRMKVEALKRRKLKNESIFISTTRLCVRNLPTHVDDKELRGILLKSVGHKSAKITECRVMRDLARPNAKGVGKSRGYAFVAFNEHQHALKALHQTNNNPDIFGKDKRPIVEFSLENKVALLAKEKRLERQMVRKPNVTGTSDPKSKRSSQPKKEIISKLSKLSEAERVEKARGKYGPKGLPTHWGAKVRHKPRTLQTPQKGNKEKRKPPVEESMSQNTKQAKTPKSQRNKKSKQRVMPDHFDKLVHSYKQKIMAASVEPPAKKSKWFNS
ncbi:hypothetical protein ScPMuIL_012843 [Solemya velum]